MLLLFRNRSDGGKIHTQITNSDLIKFGEHQYKKLGFTQHQGNSTNEGHYLTYMCKSEHYREEHVFNDLGGGTPVFRPNGQKFDKNKMKPYIMFFKKIEPSQADAMDLSVDTKRVEPSETVSTPDEMNRYFLILIGTNLVKSSFI